MADRRRRCRSHHCNQQDEDIRVLILGNGGAHERRDYPSWKGRNAFVERTQSARTVEELIECARDLQEATFDHWDPQLEAACPCCDKRTIDPSLSPRRMVAKLREHIWTYAALARLERLTNPRYDLEEQIAALVWARFHEVRADDSAFGYCSLTASCAHDPDYMPWNRRHLDACHAHSRLPARAAPDSAAMPSKSLGSAAGSARDYATLARIKFAEGLSQVLGLRMPWVSLRTLVDELSEGDSRGKIHFDAFLEKAVRNRAPEAQALATASLNTVAGPVWTALERDGLEMISSWTDTDVVSRARWDATICPKLGIKTLLSQAHRDALFDAFGDGDSISMRALLHEVVALRLDRLVAQLPDDAAGLPLKLARGRIEFASRLLDQLS